MERMPDANGNGTDVTVYTTEPCAFCRQAKALLTARGID
jgi:glutaredoxin